MDGQGRRSVGEPVNRFGVGDDVGRLVISRIAGEAFLIEGGIRVEVFSVKKGQVRISIQAPKGVAILREELLPRDGK